MNAHHGFHGETQAAVFFREVLKPEYTILATATPDDKDLRDLEERMQIAKVHTVSVSRADAVGAGLIKDGIKCIAWGGRGREPARWILKPRHYARGRFCIGC